MNSKEIIFKAIKREKTPRVPVSLLSGGVWTFNRYGLSLQDVLLNPEQQAELIAKSNEDVKSDIVWAGSGYHNLVVKTLGGKIKFRKKGAPDVQEPLFKDARDVANYKVETIYDDKEVNSLWRVAGLLRKSIGDSTLVGASQWGPFTLAGAFYGVEKLMRNIYRDKNAAKEVLEFTSELTYQYLVNFVKEGAEIVSTADPTASGDMISRKQFEEFSLPYLKKLTAKLHEHGAKVVIHICGDTTNRLDLIPEIGADFLSFDYKVDVAKAKEILGPMMAFSGNMNPVAIMQNATPDGVRAACLDCIKKAGNTGYILMPGCDIPHGVPLENIKAMVETAHNYKYEE